MDEKAKLHCMGILKGLISSNGKALPNLRIGLSMPLMKISCRFLRSGGTRTRILKI